MALIIKKLVVLQGHCKVQWFVSTEYCILDGWNISSDLDVLFKDGLFEVLSHRCDINNKEVSSFSGSHIEKYNLYGLRATTISRDFIIALKIGKSKILGFSHFEGKYQFYCTRLVYINKAETVIFASKV